jgi:hypothetical protein
MKRYDVVVRRFVLVLLAFLSLGCIARADENGNPVFGPLLLPFDPILPLSTPCAIGLRFMIANNLSGDTGDWGLIAINVEEWRLELSLRHSLGVVDGQALEGGAQFGIKALWGGILDVPLDWFHQLLGVGANPRGQQNQVLIYAQFGNDNPARLLADTAIGLTDPLIYLGGASRVMDVGVLFWKVQAQLPLGDPSRFLGAGVPVVGGSLGFQGWNYGLTVNTSLPLEGVGRSRVFDGVVARPTLGVQIWYEPRWDFLPEFLRGFRAELGFVTSPLEVPSFFGYPVLTIRIGFGGFGFAEDITSGLPDVVFDQRLLFGCPW